MDLQDLRNSPYFNDAFTAKMTRLLLKSGAI